MSHEHLIRTAAVALAFLATLGTYLYCVATGDLLGTAPRLEGMLLVLGPALLDSARVTRQYTQEKRRLNQAFGGISGVSDRKRLPPR